jgi:hypothetical protein
MKIEMIVESQKNSRIPSNDWFGVYTSKHARFYLYNMNTIDYINNFSSYESYKNTYIGNENILRFHKRFILKHTKFRSN